MAKSDSHEHYRSPFNWRYGSDAMRRLWGEAHRRRLWRRIWVVLAAAQAEAGLVTPAQVDDLRAHQDQIDLDRAHALEAELHHDVMAEIRTYAEQCPVGGGIIHLGATSTDVLDNADALRLRAALGLVEKRLRAVLAALANQVERWADVPAMGFTHLQPAEPTTTGYRLAQTAQDLLADWRALRALDVRGKGIKGAVGTSASYAALLDGTGVTPADLEARVMALLDLPAYPVTTQTYPRKQDWQIGTVLAGIAGSLYRFAFDLRVLQSPPIGEWSEPFGTKQVGSSAMPFKRNPVKAENLDSLGRWVAAQVPVLWDNAAHSLLERTLDDSGNRRVVLPGIFLAVDEMLIQAERLITGLQINTDAAARNLAIYGPFAAVERLLMALARAGADRQAMHEHLRQHSLAAWTAVQAGQPNPLIERLCGDDTLRAYVSADAIRAAMHADDYTGDAPQRARALAESVRAALAVPREHNEAANRDTG
ncbi:MAG: adenylosuccinate lyase [Anaerolineae bacterium]|nr:adenylosuccinate lyase [Anaerolineae bacterium]